MKFDWKVASKEVFDMPYIKGKGPSVVVALGGNALGNTPAEQLELVKNTASHIVDMVNDGVTS